MTTHAELNGVEVALFVGDDGRLVVQIDTYPGTLTTEVRIGLNDSTIAQGDPERTTFEVGKDLPPKCRNCGNPIHPFGPDEYGNQWAHDDAEESFDCPDSNGVIVAEPGLPLAEQRRQYWRRVRVAKGWQAANNGSGAHRWFVTRETMTGQEWHENSRGDLIRYLSHEAAQKVAEKLNAAEASA